MFIHNYKWNFFFFVSNFHSNISAVFIKQLDTFANVCKKLFEKFSLEVSTAKNILIESFRLFYMENFLEFAGKIGIFLLVSFDFNVESGVESKSWLNLRFWDKKFEEPEETSSMKLGETHSNVDSFSLKQFKRFIEVKSSANLLRSWKF